MQPGLFFCKGVVLKKYKVAVIGATGMVGQRLVSMLATHPWFELSALAASPRSAGKTYEEAVFGRWHLNNALPQGCGDLLVLDGSRPELLAGQVDFVFCALSLDRERTRALEEAYARLELPVISNNSACRGMLDVPMLIPEINPEHSQVIPAQKKRLGTQRGFIAVKSNCSIQSYVPALSPLMDFEPRQVMVCTCQAVSGAGRTLLDWPEARDNVIPHIGGEEEKSELEPLKIWGELSPDKSSIQHASWPKISAQCLRVSVQDGHLAAVSVKFKRKPRREDILKRWQEYQTLPQRLGLPSAPTPFLIYHEADNRPQPLLDAELGGGMAVSIGRLREDPVLDWRFVSLSHNTLRGAAGGSILSAELLCTQGYL